MDKTLMAFNHSEDAAISAYEERIAEHSRNQFKEFYDELERLTNFLILREGYIPEKSTPERFIETIRRFEKEVFGKIKTHHPRTAHLKIGQVVNLKDHYANYQLNKKKTCQTIASILESDMAQMLQASVSAL